MNALTRTDIPHRVPGTPHRVRMPVSPVPSRFPHVGSLSAYLMAHYPHLTIPQRIELSVFGEVRSR